MAQLLREQRITNRLLARIVPRPEPNPIRETTAEGLSVLWFVIAGIVFVVSFASNIGCVVGGCLLIAGYLASMCGKLDRLIRCSAHYDVPLRDESPAAPPSPPAMH
jgi:hypothetical protein